MSKENGRGETPTAAFLRSEDRYVDISYEDARVHLRKSVRMTAKGSHARPCLDLVSVTRFSRHWNIRYDPSAASTGFMARLMDDLEGQAARKGRDIYVEFVITEWLPDWLERRGYTRTELPDPPSFWKPSEETEKAHREKERNDHAMYD